MNKININPTKSVLITDLDNTLFDWFTIWYESFNALISKTSEITGIEREILIQEIKPIHQLYGTAEYAFVLEKLPSLQKIYKNDKNILLRELDEAIHASRSARMTHLKLYKGVYDTLSELRSRRVRIIAYTESKEWYTKNRIKKLGLDYFIERLYSPEDHTVPIKNDRRTIIKFENMIHYHTPPNEKKPNPALLLEIIKSCKVSPEDCVYVGDSELRDIDMAYNAGVTSIFAKYGTTHFSDVSKGYELLRQVTHWTEEEVENERQLKLQGTKHKADFEIDNFSELLEIINFGKKNV
jgi:phosphoglycolate phosphatase-like HAD superfamily hydrolase